MSEYVKPEKLNKKELDEYCHSIGIQSKGIPKKDLIEKIDNYLNNEIIKSIKSGNDEKLLFEKINDLANYYSNNLKLKIDDRKNEMELDDNSHYLIYQLLGITFSEGKQIDLYQNTGRFLYKYAGSFLEDVSLMCFRFKNIHGKKTKVENTVGQRPKTFEIDFLDNNNAIEVKWRDATTDGDHITKEHTRAKCIKNHGYNPIRVMYYKPQRSQAIKIQATLKTLYTGIGGQYYSGEDAWDFMKDYTGYDLKLILNKIAKEKF